MSTTSLLKLNYFLTKQQFNIACTKGTKIKPIVTLASKRPSTDDDVKEKGVIEKNRNATKEGATERKRMAVWTATAVQIQKRNDHKKPTNRIKIRQTI